MYSRFILVLLLLAGVSSVSRGISDGQLKTLLETAKSTREKQKTTATSWRVLHGSGDGNGIELKVTESAELRVVEFSALKNGQREHLGEIYAEDDAWYVRTPIHKPIKYRPFEANLVFPSFYAMLQLSGLSYAEPALLEQAHIVSEKDGVTEVAVKSGPEFDAVKAELEKIRSLLKSHPKLLDDPETKASYDAAAALVRNGIRARIETATGLLLGFDSSARVKTEFSHFEWLAEGKRRPDEKWIDRASPLQGVGTAEIAMAVHVPFSSGKDKDVFVLNLKTHAYRRVPFPSGPSMGGCFLPGRSTVLVHGFDLLQGGCRPYIVDLKTAESSPFLHEIFPANSLTFGGSVSENGKELALLHLPSAAAVFSKQIYRIDLTSERATKVGPAGDYFSVQWISKGRELLVGRAEPEDDLDKAPPLSVCVMDLSGRVRVLASGSGEVPLTDDKILFQQSTDKRWMTIGVNGRGKKAFRADIPPNCGSPTISPDRKWLLLVQFEDGSPKGRVMVNLETHATTSLPWPAGIWSQPIW